MCQGEPAERALSEASILCQSIVQDRGIDVECERRKNDRLRPDQQIDLPVFRNRLACLQISRKTSAGS